jgi:hypothetical protein
MHRVPILCFVALLLVLNGAASQGQPLGPEFRVNTYITNGQLGSSIARDATGNFVVVWVSMTQDGSSGGIFGQRYASTGAPLGGEFRVNTYTTNLQTAPFVASDDAGNFVVFWSGADSPQNNNFDIFGQRYDATGAPLGGEFRVNAQTAGNQFVTSVASDPAGTLVVAFQSYGQDGSGYGVFAQRYASTGDPLGDEFQVNTFTTRNQRFAAVTSDALGNFVIAWSGATLGPGHVDILAQRYNSSGRPLGGEFRVNTYTSNDQRSPAIASDSAGNFVIVWESNVHGGIFGQRYSRSGAPLGGEFRVNTYTLWDQYAPSVASDPDGNFVVTWSSMGIEGHYYLDVFAQRYSSSGDPLGGQFRVNTYTLYNQIDPFVLTDPSGNYVVTWTSCWVQDGSGCGIYGQRYGPILPLEAPDFPVE